MKKKVFVLVAIVLISIPSIFAQAKQGYSITGSMGLNFESGMFSATLERYYGNRSLILQYKHWDFSSYLDTTPLDEPDPYWRGYLAGGYRQYIGESSQGGYVQGTFELGLPYDIPNDSLSTSPEGVGLTFGIKEVLFRRLIIDLGLSYQMSLSVLLDQPLTTAYYLSTLNIGLGLQP